MPKLINAPAVIQAAGTKPKLIEEVLAGAVHVIYGDGSQEISRAGEVFYWPPPHTVRFEVDTEILEFSPRAGLRSVYEHIGRKLGQVPFPVAP